jgi:hypothetical protein
MAYATDDTTVKLIPRMKQVNNGAAKSALASLKELEDICQLPKAKELWTKQDRWIDERKDEIAEAIRQFENYVRRSAFAQRTDNLVWQSDIRPCLQGLTTCEEKEKWL